MKHRLSQEEFLRLRDLMNRNHTLIDEQTSVQTEIANILSIQTFGPTTDTMNMQSITPEMWMETLHIVVEEKS